jgi:hypothetical protein
VLALVVISYLNDGSTDAAHPQDRLTPAEVASLEGTLQVGGSDIEVTMYNGTERYLTSAVVYIAVFRDWAQMISRRYFLLPSRPALTIPPLSVGQFSAEAGFYRLYGDSVAWSVVEVRGR